MSFQHGFPWASLVIARTSFPQLQPLVNNCQFGVSPVNYSETPGHLTFLKVYESEIESLSSITRSVPHRIYYRNKTLIKHSRFVNVLVKVYQIVCASES